MCIVIDANVFSRVFNNADQQHGEFRPVHDWIVYGEGKMVYGGSRYQKELERARTYRKLIVTLMDAGKIYRIDGTKIDSEEAKIIKIDNRVKDPHLIAIVIVSGCKLVCTKDRGAIDGLTDKRFYAKPMTRPKIYSGYRTKNLLCKKYIVVCKAICN